MSTTGSRKRPDLFDHRHQLLDVRVRRIALVGRRLDPIDRQRHDQDRRPAERIPIRPQDGAAVLLDRARQIAHDPASSCRVSETESPVEPAAPFCAGAPLLCFRHLEDIRLPQPCEGGCNQLRGSAHPSGMSKPTLATMAIALAL
jgi:hypothetical protein